MVPFAEWVTVYHLSWKDCLPPVERRFSVVSGLGDYRVAEMPYYGTTYDDACLVLADVSGGGSGIARPSRSAQMRDRFAHLLNVPKLILGTVRLYLAPKLACIKAFERSLDCETVART